MTDQFAGPALVGFGAEMNPYLYCKPNWGAVTEENVKDFERKVIDLRPQHVRIFFLQHWFDGRADGISKGDPRTAESFIRACQLAQRAGATINVTNWFGPWEDPERQMADFVAVLHTLVNERKLHAIRYVTIQNEVNGGTKVTKEKYVRLYRALDAQLRRARLRDQIKIVSGDLVQDNQEEWFQFLGRELAGVSDGYSIHAYWDYWDTPKLVRRTRLPREIVDALPREQQRPLYITEFGVRGHRKEPRLEPGEHEDGAPIATKPLQAMQLACFQMEALNRGYVATVIWTLEDAWYDRLMPYGTIGTVQDGWPLKPSYHMLRLFTHTIPPGWRALKIDGAAEGTIVSAARGPKGELTVLALNQSEKPQAVTLAGLRADEMFAVQVWNADGRGKTTGGKAIRATNDGGATLDLPSQGLVALTTENPG